MRLTWKQRLLITIKRQKKQALMHTTIASIVCLVLLALLQWWTPVEAAPVQKDKRALVTVTMVGDMMFARNMNIVTNHYGYDYLFQYARPYFQSSDLVTGNFENPIVLKQGYPLADKFIHLKTGPEAAKVLARMGFDVVNLANNHMKDFGKPGLMDTRKVFRQTGVDTVGAGRDLKSAKQIRYYTVNGVKVAVLGMSEVLPKGFRAHKDRSGILPADPNIFMPLVAKAKRNADLVLVHIHWGIEYDSHFHPRQRDLAHALADAGADIIIGHHPHVLEPIEVYNNSVIFYSLGNFVFDQGWSRTKETALVQYKLYPDGKARIEVVPMMIRQGQPRPVFGWTNIYRREKIFSEITNEPMYTDQWNQVWKREGDLLVREVDHSRVLKGMKQHGQ